MPRACPAAATYQRRQPEQTVLYRTIAAHLPTFLARTAGEDGTGGWPAFVRREFEAYLRYGRLAHGLLRVRCQRCGDSTVVAFSCCPHRNTIESAARRAWWSRAPAGDPLLILSCQKARR